MKQQREQALRNLRVVIERSAWLLRSLDGEHEMTTAELNKAHEAIANELERALGDFRDTVSGNLWSVIFEDRGRVHITQLPGGKIELVPDKGDSI